MFLTGKRCDAVRNIFLSLIQATFVLTDSLSVFGSYLQTSEGCNVAITTLEIAYFDLDTPNSSHHYDIIAVPHPLPDTPTTHTIHGLTPYTWYGMRVRSMGEWQPGNGTKVVSEFSNVMKERTKEGGMCVHERQPALRSNNWSLTSPPSSP